MQQSVVGMLTPREVQILQLFEQGLSNREVSSKLYLTVGTVKWHAQQVYNKLGVSTRGDAVQIAQTLGLLDDVQDAEVALQVPNNLPAEVDAFIGRQQEINQLRLLLSESRLVTLTGPGGIGKTRLALHLAGALLRDFPDGVFFIDLSHLPEAGSVAAEIAFILGLNDSELLEAALSKRRCLLVLDNFEHVIDAAPLLSQLLHAAPDFKLLVTSREVLNLRCEQRFPVLPLTLPQEAGTLDQLEASEAVHLFVQRAQAIRPEFVLNGNNAEAVAAICRRLDGLPLAIELAASCIRLFSPSTMLRHLSDSYGILASNARDVAERHRTLSNAITWSYNLLASVERELLAQLAALPDGVTVDDVDTACPDLMPLELINTINALVDKSLVQQYEDVEGEVRLRLLRTIRSYMLELPTRPVHKMLS